MSAPIPQILSTATGRTDSTSSSSSSSAARFNLNESDTRPILVYNHHESVEKSTQQELCRRLLKNDRMRVTKKPIPRAAFYVEIRGRDFWLPEEQQAWAKYWNAQANLACIKLPWSAYFGRLLLGSYNELYIVTGQGKEHSSVADSESRRCSPESTLGKNSQDTTTTPSDQSGDDLHIGTL